MNDLQKKYNNSLRIISVVPSQTELLFDLGLTDEVVGITKFCVHPKEWFRTKTKVGGTKNLNMETIRSLNPNLILANKEENTKEQIEELQKQFPVYVSNIQTIDHALEMILEVGQLVNKGEQANNIEASIKAVKEYFIKPIQLFKTLYLIWYKPYMAAGTDTFIHCMMQAAGFENCIKETRYPSLSFHEIKQLSPELILLSSEPYPFKQKHIDELLAMMPMAKIKLVDGELFSWYGSRMSQSFEYFRALNEELT